MLAALLLAGALAMVAYGWVTGKSFAGRLARLMDRSSRPRAVLAWAVGTAVSFGVTSLLALAMLGRLDAVVDLPVELLEAAWALGLPGWAPMEAIAIYAMALAVGAALGTGVLVWRARRGLGAWGPRYRSPAAVRAPGEWRAAAALSLAAGVGEELFFRLTLPLLVAIVFGSGVAGVAVGWAAFTAGHRHQGWGGMAAVAVVGGVLAWLYLLTGRLWLVMALHVLVDLNALILRPWLTRKVEG